MPKKEERCSFCGRPRSDTNMLISGIDAHICDYCVDQAQEILQEEMRSGKQGFACAGFTYENDVRFFYFNIIAGGRLVDSFKMVIDCH